jgi:hypothetical protein
MSDNNITILDQLTAVNLSVAIWSARQKLTAEDFGGVELPPEELASLGSKKICDPDRLKVFTTLKARAVNQLDKIGVRFLGGWVIPDYQTQFIYDRLLEVKNDFLTAKDDFLSNYDLAVKSWVDKHPGWERLIAESPVSIEHVCKRLSFNWQFYKVVPSGHNLASDDLETEVENLGSTLFGEIAKEAHMVWNKVYAGKTEVSHKALSPLRAMKQKLSGLSFVEPRVAPIADLIEAAIASIPKRGLISGQHLLTLQGLVSVLKDPVLLFEHGQKVRNGQPLSDVLSSFSPVSNTGGLNNDQEDVDSDACDQSTLPFDLIPHDSQEQDELNGPEDFDNNRDEDLESNDNEQVKNEDRPDKKSKAVPYLDSLGLW